MNLLHRLTQRTSTIRGKVDVSAWAVNTLLGVLVLVVVAAMGVTRFQVVGLMEQTEGYLETSVASQKANDLLQFMRRAVSMGNGNAATEFEVRAGDLKDVFAKLEGLPVEGATLEEVENLRELYREMEEPLLAVFSQLSQGQQEMAQIDLMIAEELYSELLSSIKKIELALSESLTNLLVQLKERMLLPIIVVVLLSVVVIAVTTLINRHIKRSIRPLSDTIPIMEAMAHGDLTQRLKEEGHDEVAQIAKALNLAINSISEMLRVIDKNTDDLAGSSQGIFDISAHMNENVESTGLKTTLVSQASDNISSHVQSVVGSVSQLKASIQSVSKEAHSVVDTVKLAVEKTEHINGQVAELNASSAEISNVTNIISDVAEKTNLLALNAAIEAARAGEAGRGFAIVANEVKQLASETAVATRDIGGRVQMIQAATKSFVEMVGEIAGTIENISANQTAIAGAVEEQTAATEEIYQRIEEAEGMAGGINQNIGEVVGATHDTRKTADDVREFAERLASMSQDLRRSIQNFKC